MWKHEGKKKLSDLIRPKSLLPSPSFNGSKGKAIFHGEGEKEPTDFSPLPICSPIAHCDKEKPLNIECIGKGVGMRL